MIRAFLYDAEAEDCETSVEEGLPALSEKQLLWIEVTGRDDAEIRKLQELLKLDPQSANELRSAHRTFELNNYGVYFQFDVLTIAVQNGGKIEAPRVPNVLKIDFIVGKQWLVTVNDEELQFLQAFRDQDRGETLIGNLSPASLAAALLDWHLNGFLTAMERLESFVDALDLQMLARKSIRQSLLAQVVAGRRYVSSLGRMLGPQRAVFYGLSRPDFALVAESNAAAHYAALEHRFERTLDSVEHGRELMKGSFDLYSTRVNETTNVLIRRLTFLSLMLGMVGAAAGIFGMNFETPYTESGVYGFWAVLAGLGAFIALSAALSFYRKWI
jgi:magnesium transporter